MIIFQSDLGGDRSTRLVLVFGVGLIGASLCEAITLAGGFAAHRIPYAWDDDGRANEDSERLYVQLKQLLQLASVPYPSLSVMWSAGRAGFSAVPEETAAELASYERVLSILQRILDEFPIISCYFHLVSSAGGLFEGAGVVQPDTDPKPMRHYGRLKLSQEQLLQLCEERLVKHVYRPASVYGYFVGGARLGLITALVLNGIRNRVSTIFGTMNTLRDYVLNRDIGTYIASQLFSGQSQAKPIVHYLAGGKPSSIFEIQQIVEKVLGKKLLIQYQGENGQENIHDISINPVLLPDGWAPVDVRTGVGYLTDRIIAEEGPTSFF